MSAGSPTSSSAFATRDAALPARQRGFMHRQPFGDDLAHRHPRRQAAERVLEDDLHVARAAAAALRLSSVGEVGAVEADAALGCSSRSSAIAHGGFAGAAFADQRRPFRLRAPRRSTPSTAFTWPTVRRRTPRRIGKCTRTSVACDQRRRASAQRPRLALRLRGQQHAACRDGCGAANTFATPARPRPTAPFFITHTRSA